MKPITIECSELIGGVLLPPRPYYVLNEVMHIKTSLVFLWFDCMHAWRCFVVSLVRLHIETFLWCLWIDCSPISSEQTVCSRGRLRLHGLVSSAPRSSRGVYSDSWRGDTKADGSGAWAGGKSSTSGSGVRLPLGRCCGRVRCCGSACLRASSSVVPPLSGWMGVVCRQPGASGCRRREVLRAR